MLTIEQEHELEDLKACIVLGQNWDYRTCDRIAYLEELKAQDEEKG